jgi:hypothetical protein
MGGAPVTGQRGFYKCSLRISENDRGILLIRRILFDHAAVVGVTVGLTGAVGGRAILALLLHHAS